MNAETLLDALLRMRAEGVELSDLTVVNLHVKYDPSIPYDTGVEEESYPDEVVIHNGELFLR